MMNKKISTLLLCFAVGISSLLPQATYASSGAKKIQAEIIAPGVEQASYYWQTNYGNIYFNVLKCDLNNKNLDLRVVAGKGSYTKRATVSQMANNTNAVAVINGDYFNTALQGAPLGPSVINGELHSSPAFIDGIFAMGIDKENNAHIEKMNFIGQVTAPNGDSFPIDGLNKTTYWYDPSKKESHTGTIQLYDDYWTSPSRGHKTNSEALISGENIIEKISIGKPFSMAVPKGKKIIQFGGKAKDFILGNFNEGEKINFSYELDPNRDWKLVIGGHAMLVDNGKVIPYTKSISSVGGIRARSAIGISKDKKTVWIVGVEGRTARSVGSSLPTLGNFFTQLGAEKAINLDGGGSTAVTLRKLGESNYTKAIRPERLQGERAVVNGLGVYNSLPKTGVLKGFELSNNIDTMFIGEKLGFSVEKAWDTNLHPIAKKDVVIGLTSEPALGDWSNNTFHARQAGKTQIIATSDNGIVSKKNITVLNLDQSRNFYIKPKTAFVLGKGLAFDVVAYDNHNKAHKINSNVLNWTIDGATGHYDDIKGEIFIEKFTKPWASIAAKSGSKTSRTIIENPSGDYLKLYIGKKYYKHLGEKHSLDAPPIISNNRTMVPLRFIVEAFNGEVQWEQESKTVHCVIKGKTFKLPINSKNIEVNNTMVSIDSPAIISNDYTYVPVRFISENLGFKIGYDNLSNTVFLAN